MITYNRHSHMWDVQCDNCSHETLEVNGAHPIENGFVEAIKEIKEKGWTCIKEGEEWLHLCLECSTVR